MILPKRPIVVVGCLLSIEYYILQVVSQKLLMKAQKHWLVDL